MLSRFVRDDADQTRRHFFFGTLLILLSLAVGSSMIGYAWQSHSVLGTQTIVQSLQTGEGSGIGTSGSGDAQQGGSQEHGSGQDQGGNGNIEIIDQLQPEPTQTQVIQQPTSIPQPSEAPAPIPAQPTPTPVVVGSVPELIDGAGPQTEVIIKNDDNALVISTTKDPNHVAIIDTGGSLSGEIPQSPSTTTTIDSTSQSGVIETVLTYNPTTRKYDEVPVVDSEDTIRTSENTTTLDALTNSIVKVFSQETYFPTESQATRNVVNLNTTSNFEVFDWLTKYQFQILPIGSSHLAIYRNGITTLTRFPIVLGLSRQSLGVLIDGVYKPILHYPDTTWEGAVDNKWVSADTHDEPITLTDQNGELIYKIEGTSKQLFFAFFPVSVCRRLEIYVESQELRSISTCSTKDAVLERLSIML